LCSANRPLLIEVGIILLIVYTDSGNALFGTAPLTAEVWLFAMPFAVALLVMEEGRKWLVRRSESSRRGAPVGVA